MIRYTVSLIWHPTLTTGVLPLLGLLYMNSHIFLTIRSELFPIYFHAFDMNTWWFYIYLWKSSERPGKFWAAVRASNGKVNLILRWISIQQTESQNIVILVCKRIFSALASCKAFDSLICQHLLYFNQKIKIVKTLFSLGNSNIHRLHAHSL